MTYWFGAEEPRDCTASFIEESTVKVHAHHIYDKLGIRSRTALTIDAMLERADQATSATDSSGSSSGSS
jgi:hypothetical protein